MLEAPCISTESKTFIILSTTLFYHYEKAERMQTKLSSPDSDVIGYVIIITEPFYFVLVPISFPNFLK